MYVVAKCIKPERKENLKQYRQIDRYEYSTAYPIIEFLV
jgi:hypothetical protein